MEVHSGDEQDFRRIYRADFSMLLRVVYHITNNEDVAEEICQEAFIRFYDKATTFPSEDDAKYWLIRVAKNLAINQIKRRSREQGMVEKLKKQPEPAPQMDGVQTLVEKQTSDMVRSAIMSLPEKFRLVIILKEYTDMDYAQIAKQLGISVSNVKVRVFRARRMLAKTLGSRIKE